MKNTEPADTPDVYRERAMVVAALARILGTGWIGTDTDEPDWPVLYIETAAGQLSWHISPTDADVLAGIQRGDGKWDGHTTAEKYQRLARLPLAQTAPTPSGDTARWQPDGVPMTATPPPAPDARTLAEEWAYACAMVGYNPPPTLEDAFEAGWNTREGWSRDYRNPLAPIQALTLAEIRDELKGALVASTPAEMLDDVADFVASVDWSPANGEIPAEVASLLAEIEILASNAEEGVISPETFLSAITLLSQSLTESEALGPVFGAASEDRTRRDQTVTTTTPSTEEEGRA